MVFLYRNFEENIIKINKLLGFFELEETVNIKPQKIKLFESLQIKNLEFKYGENQEILKSINFSIQSGQKIAII
jgi:ABC-type transport system involved in Fe-S cluster assembly fused permease/ATPase subunit